MSTQTVGREMAARIARGRRQWGDKFDPAGLTDAHPSILRAFETGDRVEVTRTHSNGETFVRRGRVGTTTGWAPALLLVHRRGSTGSWDVLGPDDVVTRIV